MSGIFVRDRARAGRAAGERVRGSEVSRGVPLPPYASLRHSPAPAPQRERSVTPYSVYRTHLTFHRASVASPVFSILNVCATSIVIVVKWLSYFVVTSLCGPWNSHVDRRRTGTYHDSLFIILSAIINFIIYQLLLFTYVFILYICIY